MISALTCFASLPLAAGFCVRRDPLLQIDDWIERLKMTCCDIPRPEDDTSPCVRFVLLTS